MISADFAAAQERILARRRNRVLEAATRPPIQENLGIFKSLPGLSFSQNGLRGNVRGIWHLLKGRDGTRPAFRVGQVDAELLDEELQELLKAQVGKGLKGFGVGLSLQANC